MDKILVLIQLIGGNDGINTIVPESQLDAYYRNRPTIGHKASDLTRFANNYLTHNVMTPMSNLFNDGTLAVIQGVGYANQNFSHFSSTDIWMSARPEGGIDTGWCGRALEELDLSAFPINQPVALKIGKSSSALFQATRNMGVSISSPEKFYQIVDDIEYPIVPSPWGENISYIRDVINRSRLYENSIRQAWGNSLPAIYFDNSPIGEQLGIVARLISGGLKTKIYHVTLDGFDTHALQYDTHVQLLSQLSEAIGSFTRAMHAIGRGNDVVGMTFSEFGRRTYENESKGTDHGAASVHFMFGASVLGGVYGDDPDLSQDNLSVQYDFRNLYSNALKWIGADDKSALFGEYNSLKIINADPVVPPIEELYRLTDVKNGKTISILNNNTWI